MIVRSAFDREAAMQLGMIGLGRMGSNMVRRLLRSGQECVVYDVHPAAAGSTGRRRRGGRRRRPRRIRGQAQAAASHLADGARGRRRCDGRTSSLAGSQEGDILIDGGNSYYHDDIRRAADLKPKGSITSTSAPAAASGGSSAATA